MRVQYQVNIRSGDMPNLSNEEGPYPDTRFVDEMRLARLAADDGSPFEV